MTGQIAAPGSLPLALVGVVVVLSMLAGAVDIARQPGWAWKRAEESQLAYLILDLLLPVIGLGMYAFRARPKVTAAVAAGEGGRPADETRSDTADPGAGGPEPAKGRTEAGVDPDRFAGFQEVAVTEPDNRSGPAGPADGPGEVFEISSTFFSTGAATRTVRHPLALARAYRPRQRTSLSESESESGSGSGSESGFESEPQSESQSDPQPEARSTLEVGTDIEPEPVAAPEPEPGVDEVTIVPSGWKVDPTGRHQFRFWDGGHWTENVADDGAESRDAVSA